MSLNKMQIHRLVRKINKLAPKMRQMTDEELQAQTEIFRKKLKAGMKEKDILHFMTDHQQPMESHM